MRFSVEVKDSSNPFFKTCKSNGQAMGMAIPFILESEGYFTLIQKDGGKTVLEDGKGKTYRTHYAKGERFSVSPSYQKGIGREYAIAGTEKHICETDYHIFANSCGDSVKFAILPTREVLSGVDNLSGVICVEV